MTKNITINLIKTTVFPIFLVALWLSFYQTAQAVVDPLGVPNNKFGVHIISATPEEIAETVDLVNSSGGDWGYVTVIIKSSDRNHDKWQTFFNELRRKHLIPIVRLATEPQSDYWKRPYDGEEVAWADFLDSLNWPTKNRYVIIYNEPNQGREWGNQVDPVSYAQILDKTISALKGKNANFFVLNAGLDASAPQKTPNFFEESNFLQKMNETVPGIFNKLDGWISHSYPNPNFNGSPDDEGKGTIRTYQWELQKLQELGLNKNLPIFITETGWKHSEGIIDNPNFPSAKQVGEFLKQAFTKVWSDARVVAVTPFLLSYQAEPFDHFSFKKITGEVQDTRVLGDSYPPFYDNYYILAGMPKVSGKPQIENLAQLVKGEIYTSLVAGQKYNIALTFKNTGSSVWNQDKPLKLSVIQSKKELGIEDVILPNDQRIEPGQDATFTISLNAPDSGVFKVELQLYNGNQEFSSLPSTFTTEVKKPVSLIIDNSLKWKDDYSGSYQLTVYSDNAKAIIPVKITKQGISDSLEERFLLPDYTYSFTLSRPFYHSKTINFKVIPGINRLNFGELQPDFPSAIIHPVELWKLLPF